MRIASLEELGNGEPVRDVLSLADGSGFLKLEHVRRKIDGVRHSGYFVSFGEERRLLDRRHLRSVLLVYLVGYGLGVLCLFELLLRVDCDVNRLGVSLCCPRL